MGREKRLHRERVKAGEEAPLSLKIKLGAGSIAQAKKDQVMFCKACRRLVTSSLAHRHVRDCWGGVDPEWANIADDFPLPSDCPAHIIAARKPRG